MASRGGPPRLLRTLLRLATPPGLREEVEGDLLERFERIAGERGRGAARRWAWGQLLRHRPLALWRAVARRSREGDDHRVRGGGAMGRGWGSDLVYALRAIRHRPGTSLTVAVTVAVAVGATTAVFSVVNGVLLRPLPYPEPDRLVRIWQTRADWRSSENAQLRALAERFPLAVPTLRDWTSGDTGLESLGAWAGRSFVVTEGAGAGVLRGEALTAGLFPALDATAEIGRPLLPEDDRPGAPPVAVLHHGLWLERFGGRPEAVGETLVLNGIPHTVVGVMPAGFRSLDEGARVWTPLSDEEKEGGRNSQFLQVVGRLASGVTLEEASGRLAALQARLAVAYPDEQGELGSRMVPLLDSVVGDVKATLWFLLGAVGLVVLVACVNIANVLAVRGLERRRELAVRAALGAPRGRLVRGLLVESAALAGLGGLAGVILAWAAVPALARVVPDTVPRHAAIAMDPAVALFGLALTTLTALLVGVLPALQAARAEPRQAMVTGGRTVAGGRGESLVRGSLVVCEVALAFVLLLAASLLGTSYARLWAVDRGFDPERLLVMQAVPTPSATTPRTGEGLPLPSGGPEPLDPHRFVLELHDRLEAIPGVEATATNQVPLAGGSSSTTFEVERPAGGPEEVSVLITVVLDDYHALMGIPVLEGRGLAPGDTRDAPPVAVVSRAMARALWPGESALGKRLRDDPDDPWSTVVGAVGDVRHVSLQDEVQAMIYVPAPQSGRLLFAWVLRVRGDPADVVEPARQAVAGLSPGTPVRSVEILEETIARSVAVPRFRAGLVVALAGMAGFLALLGVFGVVSFSVGRRAREIAVRMALGARRGRVVLGVAGAGVGLVVAGVAVGLVAGLLAVDVLTGFLYGVDPTDPVTLGSLALGVTLVGAGAAWLPARRAAGVDPVVVLGSE